MGFEFNFIDEQPAFVANNRDQALDGKDAPTLVFTKEQKAQAIEWLNQNKANGGRLTYGKRAKVQLVGISAEAVESKGANKTLYRKVRIASTDADGVKHVVSVNMWESNLNHLIKDYNDVDGILDAVDRQGLELVATVSPGMLPNGTKTVNCWVSHLTPSSGLMDAAGFDEDDFVLLEEAGIIEAGAQ